MNFALFWADCWIISMGIAAIGLGEITLGMFFACVVFAPLALIANIIGYIITRDETIYLWRAK